MENQEEQLKQRNVIQYMIAQQLGIDLNEFVDKGCAEEYEKFIERLQERIKPTSTIGMAKAIGREIAKCYKRETKPYDEEPDEITRYFY